MRWILASLLLLSACSTAGPQTFIAGYPVADRVAADPRFAGFATGVLDGARPGHAAISIAEVYVPDYRMPDGQRYLISATGGDVRVVVLRLVDDTVEAYLVGCGGPPGSPPVCGIADPPSTSSSN